MRAHQLIAALGLATSACGSSAPHVVSADEEAALLDVDDAATPVTSSPGESDTRSDSPARTTCYFGDLLVARTGEAQKKQGALLVKLTLDPSARTMVEETWSFPLYERFVVTRAIDGSSFAMSRDDGAFTGRGKLHGQPWMWQGWTTTSASSDSRVHVHTETAFDDGRLVTVERVTDDAGALITSVSHSLAEVPLDECANMFRKARAVADARVASRAAER